MPIIKYGLDATALRAGATKTKSALDSISKKASSVGSVLGKMFTPFNAAIGAIAGGFGAKKLADVGDEYTNMASQLEYLTGSSKEAEIAQASLYKMSQATGTSMTNNAKSLSRFALASEMTGLSMEQNVAVLGTINTLMLKTGTDTQEAANAMRQLGQALASGKLSGDEFRSMSEAAPGVMNELSKSLGVTRGELKKMSTEGKLTSEVLGAAFLKMSESGSVMAEDLPLTIGRMWTKVVNSLERMWDKINDETGVLSWVAEGFDNLSMWVEEHTSEIVVFFLDMKDNLVAAWPDIVSSFQSGWSAITSLFVDSGPQLIGVFSTMFSWLQTIVEWLNKAIDGYRLFSASFNAAAAVAEERANLHAQQQYSQQQEQDYYNNNGSTSDADWNAGFSDDVVESGSSKSVNVYINQKLSRSDVVNTVTEFTRINSRI